MTREEQAALLSAMLIAYRNGITDFDASVTFATGFLTLEYMEDEVNILQSAYRKFKEMAGNE